MAVQTITYSLASDFPGGAINTVKLAAEVAADAGITIQLNRIGVNGDGVDLEFAASLPAAERTVLDGDTTGPCGGLIAAHDNTASPSITQPVEIDGIEVVDGNLLHVHSSPRPSTMSTYFSSAGDNVGIGDGDLLGFKMLATDTSKSVTVTYSELVYIKDGYVVCQGAPFGSLVSAEILNASDVVVGSFVKNSLMLGDAFMPFDTEDKGTLPAGYKLKLTVFNSDGTGDWDAAAAFKVVARVEMYRTTTA